MRLFSDGALDPQLQDAVTAVRVVGTAHYTLRLQLVVEAASCHPSGIDGQLKMLCRLSSATLLVCLFQIVTCALLHSSDVC